MPDFRSTHHILPTLTFPIMSSIACFNLAVSWALLVLIWLVQLIVYPGFNRIPAGNFSTYHSWYAKRIAMIVGPLMLAEVILLIGWWWAGADRSAAYVATLAVFIIWLSTFRLQVPLHKRLQNGKDKDLIRLLVVTNWIRTSAWSFKTLVVTTAVFRIGV